MLLIETGNEKCNDIIGKPLTVQQLDFYYVTINEQNTFLTDG